MNVEHDYVSLLIYVKYDCLVFVQQDSENFCKQSSKYCKRYCFLSAAIVSMSLKFKTEATALPIKTLITFTLWTTFVAE